MLTEKDYCDYDTCVALKELGYDQPSIAFYPCQDIIVDCVDSNGELYEAEYYKGNLALYSSLNNKNHDINKVQAPLLYEAQKWLRENHNLHVEVGYNPVLCWYVYRVWEHQDEIAEGEAFPSYEEALSTAIYMAVEYLKGKSNGN